MSKAKIALYVSGGLVILAPLITYVVYGGLYARCKNNSETHPSCTTQKNVFLHMTSALLMIALCLIVGIPLSRKLDKAVLGVILISIIALFSIAWGIITLVSNNTKCSPEKKANLMCSNTPPDSGSDAFGSVAIACCAIIITVIIGISIKNPDLFMSTKTMHVG